MSVVTIACGVFLAGQVVSAHQRLEDSRERLARYQSVVSQKGRLEAQSERLQARRATDMKRFITAPTAAQASAVMQDYLEATVQGHGQRIEAFQVLDAQPRDGLEPVRVRISFTADHTSLRGILHTLETGMPVLMIDSLIIQPSHTMKRFTTAMPDTAKTGPSLDVTLDVMATRTPGV